MNLFLIKNIECAKLFINENNDSIFLALDSLSFEYLKSHKKKTIFPSEVLNEKLFIKKFNYDKKIKKIIKILNKILFKDYIFYKLKNWKVFDHYYLQIKRELDFAIYIKEVIKLLLKRNKINYIFITECYARNHTIIQNNNFKNTEFLLHNDPYIKNKIKKIKHKILYNNTNNLIKNYKSIIINKFKEWQFILKDKKNLFLFINFSEKLLIKKHFDSDFLNINYLSEKIISKNNIKTKNFWHFKDKNIFNLIYQFYISKKEELQLIKKKFLLFDRQRFEYKYFFFRYSINILSIIFMRIANEKKIKKFIWSHGAYGFSKSFGGYKYSDHLLFKNIGHVGNKINLPNKKITSLGYLKNFNKTSNIKKININKNKKTILFVQGYKSSPSSFYFGYDRKNISNSNWIEIREILLLLNKYEKSFNIIFKDAPYYDRNIEKIMSTYLSSKIKYVYDEYTLEYLLSISDLSIFSYASTSVVQSISYKNDIIVYEPDLKKNFNCNKFKKYGVFFFKDICKIKKKINYICKNKFFLLKDKTSLVNQFYFNTQKLKIFNNHFLNI